MNRRLISVLMFAFVVAGGASLLLYRLVIARISAPPSTTKSTAILVAVRNLEQGTMIRAVDLKSSAWPGPLPDGAIVKPADAVERSVVAPIYANEPVTESRLAKPGAGGGMAAAIPPGMRAVAIRVNEVAGVAGFVLAGSHVDVLVTGASAGREGGSANSIATTLLQNVTVLSAGQDFKKDTEGKPVIVQVVNLLVSPEQAERVTLASTQMTMQLVLRNPLDTKITEIPGVSLATLLSGQTLPAVLPGQTLPAVGPKPFPRPPVVKVESARAESATSPVFLIPRMEIIEGSKRSEVAVQKPVSR